MKKFVVIGPTMLDIHVFLEEINGDTLKTTYSPGGKGFNIAKNVQLFHIPIILSSMYGADTIGTYLHKSINENSIEIPKENKVNAPSSVFVGVHDASGETIFDKADTTIFDHQLFPIIEWNDVSTVIVLSSTNKTILEKLKEVKEEYPHLTFCLEIAGGKTISHIIPYFSLFDMYISNKKEAEYLANELNIKRTNKEFVEELLNNTFRVVLITQDKDGIMFGEKKDNIISISEKPIQKNIVISTIGAGDSVTAAFCAAYFGYHQTMEDSIHIAMEIASLTVATTKPFIDELPKDILQKLK